MASLIRRGAVATRDVGVGDLMEQEGLTEEEVGQLGRRSLLKYLLFAGAVGYADYYFGTRKPRKEAKVATSIETDLDWIEANAKGFKHPHAKIIRELTKSSG